MDFVRRGNIHKATLYTPVDHTIMVSFPQWSFYVETLKLKTLVDG